MKKFLCTESVTFYGAHWLGWRVLRHQRIWFSYTHARDVLTVTGCSEPSWGATSTGNELVHIYHAAPRRTKRKEWVLVADTYIL